MLPWYVCLRNDGAWGALGGVVGACSFLKKRTKKLLILGGYSSFTLHD
jgi:hypothetical protein